MADEDQRSTKSETILDKFKFLRSLKEYVVSKIRSAKYEFSKPTKNEVSIISYDQRSFAEAEKELDLQALATSKIDREILKSFKKVLNSHLGDRSKSKTNLEILEIAEKTFARQLDIFEEILKVINTKNCEKNIMDEFQKQIKLHNDSVDVYVNGIIKNLLNELMMSVHDSQSKCEELPSQSEDVGDNIGVYRPEPSCECQQGNAGGAAVPKPGKNLLELRFL